MGGNRCSFLLYPQRLSPSVCYKNMLFLYLSEGSLVRSSCGASMSYEYPHVNDVFVEGGHLGLFYLIFSKHSQREF